MGQQVQAGAMGGAAMRPDGRGGMMPMSGGVVNQGPAQAMQRDGFCGGTVGKHSATELYANQPNRMVKNSAPAQPEHAIPQKTGKYTPPPSSLDEVVSWLAYSVSLLFGYPF